MAKRKRVRSLRCPTCKKLVLRSDAEFPFCSERCRLIDLGKWASDGYVVSTPVFDPSGPEQPREKNPEGGADSTGTEHRRH
ncbi:MAG TPA: DNA gyrase inhibitor YacG [Terriglobales bacterium]|jgi:endogenous inhibitor of DNA gyrase (YacG/DUF329 family)|nr:DNA gyrase inhibitor YacG [Terriglobales bacterium]